MTIEILTIRVDKHPAPSEVRGSVVMDGKLLGGKLVIEEDRIRVEDPDGFAFYLEGEQINDVTFKIDGEMPGTKMSLRCVPSTKDPS